MNLSGGRRNPDRTGPPRVRRTFHQFSRGSFANALHDVISMHQAQIGSPSPSGGARTAILASTFLRGDHSELFRVRLSGYSTCGYNFDLIPKKPAASHIGAAQTGSPFRPPSVAADFDKGSSMCSVEQDRSAGGEPIPTLCSRPVLRGL